MKDYRSIFLFFVFLVSTFDSSIAQDATKPIKIFILAGQSNMEGKGSVHTLNHQLNVPEKAERFARYKKGESFVEREDVWIDYLGGRGQRHGRLTVGYGISEPNSVRLFGPELGFGWTVGEHFDETVLIIKTAWGGKSIDCDFRPPSRGYPDSLQAGYEKAKERTPELTLEQHKETYGHFYRLMIEEIKNVTGDLKTYVPNYEDQGFEFAGFVWFQGWNDQYAPTSVEDYQDNLIGLIKDLRSELKSPDLAVVIGAMGHGGEEQGGKIKEIADAQAAVAAEDEFDGRVITIRTAQFWDTEAQEAFKQHWADEATRDIDKWREFGDDRSYHYFGSPHFFNQVGIAFGDSMIKLQR